MTVWTSVTGQTTSQICHDQQGAMKRRVWSGFIWLSKHFGNKQYRKNSIQLKAVLKRKVSGSESGFLALWNGNLDIWWFWGWEEVCLESSSTNGMEIYSKHTLLVTSARSETQKVLQASVQWGYATWAEPSLYYTLEKWKKALLLDFFV